MPDTLHERAAEYREAIAELTGDYPTVICIRELLQGELAEIEAQIAAEARR